MPGCLPPPAVRGIRTVHGTTLAFERATGRIVSCTPEQIGPTFGPVLAYVAPTLQHACFLFAGDPAGAAIYLEGNPQHASFVALRMARCADDFALVSLAHPRTGVFVCAAPPGEAGEPGPVVISPHVRNAFEWFTLVPTSVDVASATLDPIARIAKGPVTGTTILRTLQSEIMPGDAGAFSALAELLPEDQAQWLAGVVLMNPPTLQALQRLAPTDLWANHALPVLQQSLQGTRAPAVNRIGRELDSLATAGLDGHFTSFGHRCSALARATVAPRKTAAVLATARNEGLYLLEWVAYHRLVGFDHIFIYSNDNDDGSDDVLRILAREGAITWVESDVGPGNSAQPKAYGHAFGFLPDILNYRWTLVIDLDEFAAYDVSKFRSFGDYIGWQETQRVDCISLNWLVFGSDGMDRRNNGPLVSRFTHRLPWIDAHVKSMTRTNLCMQSRPHVPILSNPSFVVSRNELGLPFEMGSERSFAAKPSANLAWVAHYLLKSTEEFAWKNSRNRGDHALVKKLHPAMIDPALARLFVEQHGSDTNIHDPRAQECAPGLQDEIRRLRRFSGMESAMAEVERRFSDSTQDLRAVVAADPLFQGGDPALGAIARLLLANPARDA